MEALKTISESQNGKTYDFAMKCDIGDTLDGVKKIEDRSGDASTDSNSSRNPFLINWENKERGCDHEESCICRYDMF